MKAILSMVFAAFMLAGSAWAATVEEDVKTYIARFDGDPSSQNRAVEDLAWKGISDPRLFDILEQRILNEAVAARGDGRRKDTIAHYIRALGFSGQSKYISTLEAMRADKAYERHSREALEDLQEYKKWNPIISNRATFNPAYGDDVNRVMNMLRSNDLVLNRIAGKRVYFAVKDAVVLDLLEAKVRATYTLTSLSNDEADGVAWMIKGLGSTGNPKYRDLLVQIAEGAGDKAMVRHAQRSLDQFYR